MVKASYQQNKKTTQLFTIGQKSMQFIVMDPSIKGIEKILSPIKINNFISEEPEIVSNSSII